MVSLSSDNPSVASVPGTVTVASGQTQSPNFTITTFGVLSTVNVTITATFNGVSRQATLTVSPAVLSSLNVVAASIIATGTATGNTAVLAGAAPASGAVVTLSSSDPAGGIGSPIDHRGRGADGVRGVQYRHGISGGADYRDHYGDL